MKHASRLLKLVLAFSMMVPVTHADEQPTINGKVINEINLFVKSLQGSAFLYAMTPDAVKTMLEKNGVRAALVAQSEQIEMAKTGPAAPDDKFQWSEQRAQLQQRANTITEHIFALPIDQVNVTLLYLLNQYLFNDEARQPISIIFDSVFAYRFSPEQLYEYKKQYQAWQRQFSNGAFYAVVLTSVVLFLRGRKASPTTWNSLKEGLANSVESVAAKFEGVGSKPGSEIETTDDLIAMLERTGLAPRAAVKADVRVMTGPTVSRLGKMRFFSKMSRVILGPSGAKGLLLLMGGAAAGGGADVGLHALANALFPDDFNNTVLDFNSFRDDYYDGLAALRLTCLSHATVERFEAKASLGFLNRRRHLATRKPIDLGPMLMEMNRFDREFEVLKTVNSTLVDLTQLPADIKFDSVTGQVQFSHSTGGHVVTEHFDCGKLKGAPQGPISVSLNEVLRDINAMAEQLSKLSKIQLENQKVAKIEADRKSAIDKKVEDAKKAEDAAIAAGKAALTPVKPGAAK